MDEYAYLFSFSIRCLRLNCPTPKPLHGNKKKSGINFPLFSSLSLPDFDPAIHKETSIMLLSLWILGSSPRMTMFQSTFLLFSTIGYPLRIAWVLEQNPKVPHISPSLLRGAGEALSKNNRSSGCFCLQALWNILASEESVSNRSEPRCLS